MSVNQQQILTLSKLLEDRLEELLSYFNIDFSQRGGRYHFCCPVHGGDNLNGCTIYTGDRTNWVCWTHQCQYKYKNTIIGFIRGCLSHKAGREVSFDETLSFISRFLNCSLEKVHETKIVKKNEFARMLEIFNLEKADNSVQEMPKLHIFPSQYYLNRKYSENILKKFGIGDCTYDNHMMGGRAIVPYYDMDGNYVGCAGRAIYDQKPKWINSKGIKKSNYLYGLSLCKDLVLQTRTLFIVEGPGDVWRMHEAGFENCVAISGADLSDNQLLELEKSGCLYLNILTDSDEAGQKAAAKIVKKGGRRFCYRFPEVPEEHKDIGEITDVSIIQKLLEGY